MIIKEAKENNNNHALFTATEVGHIVHDIYTSTNNYCFLCF